MTWVPVTTDQNIRVANGNFQTIIVGPNVTLTLADLTEHCYGKCYCTIPKSWW